jgi:ubiquitin-like modifier-activating enzyme ATG7
MSLKAFLSPESLIEEQANLNLKLMKWRLEPNLDLPLLHGTKALILGSGTLGCNIARLLLGYGVRHMTFLDCGKVSYSNLARQSLFTTDCFNEKGEGLPKSVAAAKAIAKIAPHVYADSVDMKIPMPGHFVTEETFPSVFRDLKRLEELILTHDVIFNVFDSREARYFPTTIGSLFNKNVISVGIGYESFIVVQHGCFGPQKTRDVFDEALKEVVGDPDEQQINLKDLKEQLAIEAKLIDHRNDETDYGCFFCSDYIAPVDTISNRSMDQQCTVSRPGVSMQASATAIELFVNNIHRGKIGPQAHFIRGSTGSSFDQTQFENKRFGGCIACSAKIVQRYLTHREEFLASSLNESKNLYTYTGFVLPTAEDGDDDGEVVIIDDAMEAELEREAEGDKN